MNDATEWFTGSQKKLLLLILLLKIIIKTHAELFKKTVLFIKVSHRNKPLVNFLTRSICPDVSSVGYIYICKIQPLVTRDVAKVVYRQESTVTAVIGGYFEPKTSHFKDCMLFFSLENHVHF